MADFLPKEVIAMRVAKELENEQVVNLGIGIPSLCSQYIPRDKDVIFHSENGVLNFGPLADASAINPDFINAAGYSLLPYPGMSFMGSDIAFSMIRGGHVDVAVLGALQVSQKGDLANWKIPERGIGNVGGAMDLAAGAKNVIVAMQHIDPFGNPKIVSNCSYPITGQTCVSLIVTDVAVIEISKKGMILKEVAPGWSAKEVQQITDAKLSIANDLSEIEL